MKTLLMFFMGFACNFIINAQIPNAGFEDWDSNGNPVGWVATNSPPLYTTIVKTGDAHSGSWAVEGDVAPFSVFTIAPTLYTGTESTEGFPVNFKPVALEGYYKLISVQNDFLEIQATPKKNGEWLGAGAITLQAAGIYTKFSFNINYIIDEIPDSVLIAIFVANGAGFTNIGTKMFVDDLAWGTATEVANESTPPKEYELDQNFPNPFNPSTKIIWHSPVSCNQTLKVYDVLGNEVATLVNEEKPAGNYEIAFDARTLSSGIYFYKLQAGSFAETKKMILLK